jgi:hypothetical protein
VRPEVSFGWRSAARHGVHGRGAQVGPGQPLVAVAEQRTVSLRRPISAIAALNATMTPRAIRP